VALERKLNNVSRHETSLPEMLERMREATDAEIKTYQETSSQLFSANLTELKVHRSVSECSLILGIFIIISFSL